MHPIAKRTRAQEALYFKSENEKKRKIEDVYGDDDGVRLDDVERELDRDEVMDRRDSPMLEREKAKEAEIDPGSCFSVPISLDSEEDDEAAEIGNEDKGMKGGKTFASFIKESSIEDSEEKFEEDDEDEFTSSSEDEEDSEEKFEEDDEEECTSSSEDEEDSEGKFEEDDEDEEDDDERNDFTTSTIKDKRTSVPRKRKSFRFLTAILLDLSSEEYNKDRPKPLDSYHKKPKHVLESNGSGDQSSVQDCSSELPLNTIEVPQYKVVDHPKTKVLVQTTTKDSGTKAAVKGGKHKGAQGKSQNPAAHTQTHSIGLEQTTPSKETTMVVCREDTSKGTEKDGASSEIRDLDQPLSMLFPESCLKGRVQRQKKIKVPPQKQKRKPLGGDNMKLQIMEKGGNQTINVCNRRKQTTAKKSSTGTTVNGGEHKSARGRSQAPAAQTQTQTIGLEQTTPSKETTIVVHRGDALKETEKDWASGDIRDLDQPLSMFLQESCLKGEAQRQKKLQVRPIKETETEMDGASSDIRDLDQPLSMLLQESCLPPIIGEKGVPSDNQPTIQSVEAINCKGATMRGLGELQKSSIVVESSLSLEHTTGDTELDAATRDEHNNLHLSWPFVKCLPLWKFVESLEVFRSMPQKLHFRPLEEYNMDLREGHAIACMVNFSNLVQNINKSQIEDPLSQLQSWSQVLDGLEGHGFNVQPVRARLEKLRTLKVNYEDSVGKTISAEEQIRVLKDKKEQLAARLIEVDKEIRDQAEIINQRKKQVESITIEKELHDSHLGELMTRRHQIREGVGGVELKFDQNVASLW